MPKAITLTSLVRGIRPPPGTPSFLVARDLVYSLGIGAFLAGSAVFFTHFVGLSAIQVGVGLTSQALAGLSLSVPLGALTDRLGARKSWLVAALAQAVLFAVYPFITTFGSFLIIVVALGIFESLGIAGRAKLIGNVLAPETRVKTSAYLRAVQNLGFSAGAALAAIILAAGQLGRIAFPLLAAATFCVEALLLMLASRSDGRVRKIHGAYVPSQKRTPPPLASAPLLSLSALNGILKLNVPLLLTVIPLWILHSTDSPPFMTALVLVTNTVLAVAFQVLLSRGAADLPGASRAQARAGLALAVACLILASTAWTSGWLTPIVMLAGVAVLTAGELLTSAGAWGQSYSVAPADRRAEYIAVYHLGTNASSVLGPLALVFAVVNLGAFGWLLLAVVFLVASLLSVPLGRWSANYLPPALPG